MQFKALASIVALSAFVSVNARPTTNDICLKICAPQELTCADGWHSQKVGDYCNTCCLDQDSSLVKAAKAKAQAICWAICAFEAPSCPEGWEAKQFGDCWSCCTVESDSVSPAQTPFGMCKHM
ncbi:hypothetical protein MSAN_01109300 [Mycena sanguinolenta]|uniref:Uncharacterized protein n=1 Tax=Mycena sanguinolenta TaxID=230812 RepID=A0A8H7D6V6_9AGAR|nr:hypothetical protein MSAN_01109300 [Mycena sanguinolenta]